uniref:hypothetical protein n=1 Tax=Brucella pseudintermedia TaxID=370111 RepID=UPI001AED3708
HRQNFRPVNVASLLKSNIAAQLFQPTPRTHQPAACGAAALVVEAYIGVTSPICQQHRRSFLMFF